MLFPKARIIAVEPHAGNAAVCRCNLEGLDAIVHTAAIGPERGTARIANPQAMEWSFRVTASEQHAADAVPVLTIPDLLDAAAAEGCAPFILKCDIEGHEAKLFGSRSAWFDGFAMVSCEPHDWMNSGRSTINGFLRAHLRTRRQLLIAGENLLSVVMQRKAGA
jgi:FkbM family methyltransferase